VAAVAATLVAKIFKKTENNYKEILIKEKVKRLV
jgi:hypothetical protein